MHEGQPVRPRLIELALAEEVLDYLINSTPNIQEALVDLCAGNPGVYFAIRSEVSEVISRIPAGSRITPERIREIVAAPDDPTALPQWRQELLDRHTANLEESS